MKTLFTTHLLRTLDPAFFFNLLGLGRCSSPLGEFLFLDNWHRIGDELDASLTAIGSGVKLAVEVEIVPAVELVFTAELA